MTDPYKVLGVARNASDDDIKNAYRALAKKYHPDNFASDPTARSMAEEKMKEINEAYDAIQNSRKHGQQSYGGTSYNTGDTSYNRSSYIQVRSFINSGRIAEAENILESIDHNDRGAEWNYLKGCIAASRGQYFDAQNYISRACQMDPSNAEYRSAMNNLRGGAQSYGGYRTTGGSGMSGCDICTTLLCADCLCECCGGDLISCC